MASRSEGATSRDDQELQRRGDELVSLLKRTHQGGGSAARKAPKWAHDLLDWLWPSKK
jgi:hypothetical protein